MKKQRLVVFFLAVLFVGGLVYISLLQAAEIVGIEGNVQVQTAAEKAWKNADVGMQVNSGDSIRTARRSKATLLLDASGMNKVTLDELTMAVVNSTNPEMIDRFDLSKGKVYANLESIRSGLTFEVSTPSSVAGVRGTGYSVDSNRTRDEIAVFNREVYVRAFDQNKNLIREVTVPEGFKTMIERFQGPSDLTKLTDNERQRWNELRDGISGRGKETGKGKEADIDDQTGTMKEVNKAKDLIEEHKIDETIDQRQCTEGSEEHWMP